MAALAFYLVVPFIYLLSFLPFPVLYLVSDFVYVIMFNVVGYRKQVVLENLRKSFPQKTDKEINRICRAYYRYLCDLFLETFKTLTIGPRVMLLHCKVSAETEAIFSKLATERKSAIMVLGHYGNWEWAGNSFSLICQHQLYVIYHPIGNKQFDDLMYKMRTRFGTRLIAMKNTFKEMLLRKEELCCTAFIADQTPSSQNAYWTTFLNQDTPVFRGTEIIARKLNTPVVYVAVNKIRRGYYEICAEMLCADPAGTKDGEISEMHTRRLEQDIIRRPEIWLWSHRRWKHKKPVA